MTVDYPEWLELPVPNYRPDPLHDAIGKMISSCIGVEMWLTILLGRLEGWDYTKAERVALKNRMDQLGTRLHLLPDDDRPVMEGHLRVAKEIFKIRHAVVHSVWLSGFDSTVRQAQRPDRSGAPEWIKRNFDRNLLLGTAVRAKEISGFIQAHLSTWPDLNDDSDKDDTDEPA